MPFQTYFRLLALVAAVLGLSSPLLAATRLAVLAEEGKEHAGVRAAEALLLAALSEDPAYALLERERVRTLLAEQGLSASGAIDPAAVVAAGKVAAVDLFIFLDRVEVVGPPQVEYCRQRIVESRTGIVLDERLAPREQAQADAAVLLAGLARAARRQAIPQERRRYLSLARFRAEDVGHALGPLASALEALTAADLQGLEQVFLLDRRQMQFLRQEQALGQVGQQMRTSATVVEASLAKAGEGRVRVSLRLTTAGRDRLTQWEAPAQISPLRQKLTAAVAEALQQQPPTARRLDPAAEAEFFAARGQSLILHDQIEDALAAYEAAALLDPTYQRRYDLHRAYDTASHFYLHGPMRNVVDDTQYPVAPPEVRWPAKLRAVELYLQLAQEYVTQPPNASWPLPLEVSVWEEQPGEAQLPRWREIMIPAAHQSATASGLLLRHFEGRESEQYLWMLYRHIWSQRILLDDASYQTHIRESVEAFEAGVKAGWVSDRMRLKFNLQGILTPDTRNRDQTAWEHVRPTLAWLAQRPDPVVRMQACTPVLAWYEDAIGDALDAKANLDASLGGASQAQWVRVRTRESKLKGDSPIEAFGTAEERREALEAARRGLEIYLLETWKIPQSERPSYHQSIEYNILLRAVRLIEVLDAADEMLLPVLARAIRQDDPRVAGPLFNVLNHWLNPIRVESAYHTQIAARFQQIKALVAAQDLSAAHAGRLAELLAKFAPAGPDHVGPRHGRWPELALREIVHQRPEGAQFVVAMARVDPGLVVFWEATPVREPGGWGKHEGDAPDFGGIIATRILPDGQTIELGRMRLPDPHWSHRMPYAGQHQFPFAADGETAFFVLPRLGLLLRFHGGSVSRITENSGLPIDQITAMAYAEGDLYLGLYAEQPHRSSEVVRLDLQTGAQLTLASGQGVQRRSPLEDGKPFYVWTMAHDPATRAVWLSTGRNGKPAWRLPLAKVAELEHTGNVTGALLEPQEPQAPSLRALMEPLPDRYYPLGSYQMENNVFSLRLRGGGQEEWQSLPPMRGYPLSRGYTQGLGTGPEGIPIQSAPALIHDQIGPALIAAGYHSPHIFVICLPEDLERVPLKLGIDPRTR